MPLPEWMRPYLERLHQEYRRIGFTDEELMVQAADSMPDELTFQRILEGLSLIPSGIGMQAYYEMHGHDYEPVRKAVEEFRELREGTQSE